MKIATFTIFKHSAKTENALAKLNITERNRKNKDMFII